MENETHTGITWEGTGSPEEDECPCPKGWCGLTVAETIVNYCDIHSGEHPRRTRQSHPAVECPYRPSEEAL